MDKSRDSFKSFEACESPDLFEEAEHRRHTRRRLIIMAVSSIILVAAIVGILVPIGAKHASSSLSSKERQSIKSICSATLYQESCYSSIYSLKLSRVRNASDSDLDSPKEIFMLSLQVTLNELITLKSSISSRQNQTITTQNALNSCSRFIQDAMDHVNMSVASMQTDSGDKVGDVRTWLSTAMTDQQTCLDGLQEFESISPSLTNEVNASMVNATIFTSNSLAIISKVPAIVQDDKISAHRKVLQEPEKDYSSAWMKRMLAEADLRPNLTVSKDGIGDYDTISEAVNAMPRKSKRRFFIHVKEGVYNENVVVPSDSWNLMMYGDGMQKTVVSSNLNHVDGVGTYDSGTLIAEGRGFIAKDMTFKNTAGPTKFQAVAITSASDQSIFFRCRIDAYQDTLFTHSNRQFYRECEITGTVDFMFGNAAAVFQNCSIKPRQPMKGQFNVITAQSKSDPNQNTGISIQRCSISPLGNMTARTYFGRPWNVYSTAVVLKTGIEGIIDPAGWTTWEPGTEAPDTIFYAEYNNDGPGSGLSGRVTWPGYRPRMKKEEAEKFSVEQFIQGDRWLDDVKIWYDPHI